MQSISEKISLFHPHRSFFLSSLSVSAFVLPRFHLMLSGDFLFQQTHLSALSSLLFRDLFSLPAALAVLMFLLAGSQNIFPLNMYNTHGSFFMLFLHHIWRHEIHHFGAGDRSARASLYATAWHTMHYGVTCISPWTKAQTPDARPRAPYFGLAPGRGLGHPILGGVNRFLDVLLIGVF